MRRLVAALVCASLVVVAAHAESFNRRLARGQALLKTGDIEEAISIFRDLQVDEPDSPTLHYDIGCANYAKSMNAARENALPDAAASLQKAVESFEDASRTSDRNLRRNAQYNRATSLAQLAKQSTAGQDSQVTMENFEQAITAFEDYLRLFPDDADAQTNLNNVRYELKKYLQQTQPPEQQEKSQGSEGKNEQSDQQDENQPQPQQQDQGDQQDENQPQPQNHGEDQEQSSEENEEQSEQNESSEDQQPQTAESTSEQEQTESEPQEIEESRENIEAILDSLQDTDEQQQREMRQQPRRMAIRSRWW